MLTRRYIPKVSHQSYKISCIGSSASGRMCYVGLRAERFGGGKKNCVMTRGLAMVSKTKNKSSTNFNVFIYCHCFCSHSHALLKTKMISIGLYLVKIFQTSRKGKYPSLPASGYSCIRYQL